MVRQSMCSRSGSELVSGNCGGCSGNILEHRPSPLLRHAAYSLLSVITQIDGLVYEAFEGQAFGTDGARWNGPPNSRSHRL
jgi:hypothetical protein